ncbi:hypothetical protein SanaruYs_06360 [Chryseotalea sanaruensis]|uniref:Uncharacterized protein n=2 Tax=Chryseotalea sanaruensis TaxID=2482724 RepID=A0A401U669_9BACT|nr:hypothetical protein SanaruYs_06360 [Chryseotalea sanaruensis]
MDEVKEFDVNTREQSNHILIASQGSKFKDEVVAQVIQQLPAGYAYIKVIDVKSLTDIKEENWDVIVILHTWEYAKPPDAVKSFVDNIDDKNKLVMISTSGRGTYLIKDVDGISSASQLDEITNISNEIVQRIQNILKKKPENINNENK